MTWGGAAVVRSGQTPVPPAAGPVDPAATTPARTLPPPAGTTVHVVPFNSAAYEDVQIPPSPQVKERYPTAHRPRGALARPVMDTPVPGRAGSEVQAVPLNRSTASPPATQTLAGETGTASSAPML